MMTNVEHTASRRRLIDADALNKELQKRVGSPADDKLYEVNLCIIDAPTIPAIPVEWLRKIQANMPQTVEKVGVDVILTMWEMEQEATKG